MSSLSQVIKKIFLQNQNFKWSFLHNILTIFLENIICFNLMACKYTFIGATYLFKTLGRHPGQNSGGFKNFILRKNISSSLHINGLLLTTSGYMGLRAKVGLVELKKSGPHWEPKIQGYLVISEGLIAIYIIKGFEPS